MVLTDEKSLKKKVVEELMESNDLQLLFNEPILEKSILDPGYSGHASDVWFVKTSRNEVIVRSSRLKREPEYEFWWGLKFVFGVDPRYMIYFEHNLNMLDQIFDISAPTIIAKKNMNGKEYLIVQKMNGQVPKSFTGLSEESLHQLGTWLAKVHLNRFDYYGNLARTKITHKDNFHHELAQAMRIIVDREHEPTSKINLYLENALRELSALPSPEYFHPVLIDLGPDQFLVEDGKISAIVDVEGYVVGPREFDFVGLEYVLDEEASKAFIRGYTEILDLPDLSKCRRVYRYMYLLLGVQGSIDLDQWLGQPEIF